MDQQHLHSRIRQRGGYGRFTLAGTGTKSGIRAIEMTNAVVNFSGGDLGAPFEATYLVTANIS